MLAMVYAECVYDNLYPIDLKRFEDPFNVRSQLAPFGVAVMNEKTSLNTIDRCVNFCNGKHWCLAVSNHPLPEEHFCQFHTDMYLLGIIDHFKCDNDNFKWHIALSDPMEEDNWDGYTGFIHNVVFENYLKNHPNPEDCEFYMCGPPMMNAAVVKMLSDLGVEKDNIFLDDFGG